MARIKKETKNLNIKIDKEIYEQLETFCEETGRTKTTSVEKILQRYFDEFFGKAKEDRNMF